jgi:chromosome partitioning protein
MPVIVVANPKGGVGKSTLATQMAGALAHRGLRVMLGDVDRQQSSREWLRLRPEHLPRIEGWELRGETLVRPPKGVTHVVLDTPAGLHGRRLDEVMKLADKVLVPLQPSLFDMLATHAFVQELHAHRRSDRVAIGLVGMRAKAHTNAADQLDRFLETMRAPVIGTLRDTQNYVQLAARGLTLWDVAPSRVERDLPQWEPLLAWLDR